MGRVWDLQRPVWMVRDVFMTDTQVGNTESGENDGGLKGMTRR